jgi:hypothetical protein
MMEAQGVARVDPAAKVKAVRLPETGTDKVSRAAY